MKEEKDLSSWTMARGRQSSGLHPWDVSKLGSKTTGPKRTSFCSSWDPSKLLEIGDHGGSEGIEEGYESGV